MPVSPPFKKTWPCTIFPPTFLNLSESPPGEVIQIYFSSLKKKEGGAYFAEFHPKTQFPPEMVLLKSQQKFQTRQRSNFLFSPI